MKTPEWGCKKYNYWRSTAAEDTDTSNFDKSSNGEHA